jgi:hypothetical protein
MFVPLDPDPDSHLEKNLPVPIIYCRIRSVKKKSASKDLFLTTHLSRKPYAGCRLNERSTNVVSE